MTDGVSQLKMKEQEKAKELDRIDPFANVVFDWNPLDSYGIPSAGIFHPETTPSDSKATITTETTNINQSFFSVYAFGAFDGRIGSQFADSWPTRQMEIAEVTKVQMRKEDAKENEGDPQKLVLSSWEIKLSDAERRIRELEERIKSLELRLLKYT
jgi:hypothetical protein